MDDVYLFADYASTLLKDPAPGELDLLWSAGVGDSGNIPCGFDLDHTPHLMILGRSGSGKTEMAYSCLIQLCHNNSPDDLRVWIAEPKNQLQAFCNVAHVERFVDAISVGGFLSAATRMLSAAVGEMNRRYRAFAEHPDLPMNVAEGRRLAAEDPLQSGYLDLPHILIVLEEFSVYYPSQPAPDGMWARWRANLVWAQQRRRVKKAQTAISELARKARPAGISLMLISQAPPMGAAVRMSQQASTTIALAAPDLIMSEAYIGTAGLEEIESPGKGRIGVRGESESHRLFRGYLIGSDGLRQMLGRLPSKRRSRDAMPAVGGTSTR